MNLLSGLFLSLVQGVTEFVPVSSSGHLFLVQKLFSLTPSLSFTVFLHLATLLVVLLYFQSRFDFLRQNFLYIILGSLPAGIIGLLFKDQIETAFADPPLSVLFLITALLLVAARFLPVNNRPLNFFRALFIGLFQAVAILPGISRSGATLFAASLVGLNPSLAFDFSFALFVPASLGSSLLEFRSIAGGFLSQPQYLVYFATTFFIGLFAFRLLKKTTVSRKNWLFSIYLCLLSLALSFL